MKRKFQNLMNNIILLLSVSIFCFLILELTLSIVWDSPKYGYPQGLHIPDETKGFKYKPNFSGNFPGEMFSDIKININSKGLRDYEHSYKKNKKLRILGLGDSVTFGSGVSLEDTYLYELESKLNSNNFSVEIIKAGVNSYEFDQQYTYYFEEGHLYNPDIVMMGIVLNDPREINLSELKEEKKIDSIIFDVLFNNLKTFRFSYYVITNSIPHVRKLYNDRYWEKIYDLWKGDSWDRYSNKLIDFNNHLKKKDKKLILVIFPYTQQFSNSMNYSREPQKKLINLAEDKKIPIIDLIEYLDTEDYESYYLPMDNVHLNEKGYKLVSDLIYSRIIEEDLLNGKK